MTDDFPTFSDGRYRIESRLGHGGMAAVFRAWDNRLQVYRAIKCLDPNLSFHPDIRQRFEAEARTMASINHPNIVAVQDVGNVGSRFFIIMELVTGGSLWDRVTKHGVLHPQHAIDAVVAIAKGLGAAHKRNIIHRDVKPHNILIAQEGVLKVTDFGVARIEGGDSKTNAGALMGTLNYMAPEQRVSARQVTVASDIYAIGASMYAIMVGKSNENLFDVEEQEKVFINFEAPLASFLKKACHSLPEERYTNTEEMIEELLSLKGQIESAPEDALPLFIPGENSFDDAPSEADLTDLRTSWSQYGVEDTIHTSSEDDSLTMNVFGDEFEVTLESESNLTTVSEEPTVVAHNGSDATKLAGVLFMALVIFGGFFVFGGRSQVNPPDITSEVNGGSIAKEGKSAQSSESIGELSLNTIALVPFKTQSDNANVQILATGLFQDIASGLSLSVSKLSIMPLQAVPADLGQEVQRIKAGYVIDGSLQSVGDQLRVNVKLLDAEDLSIVWSETFKRNMANQDLFTIQDDIVEQIVDALVGNGFIMAEEVQKKSQGKGANDLSVYECRSFAYHFYKTYLPEDYEKVNACLRESIKVEPDYAELYYHLAHINFVAWQMGYKTDDSITSEAIEFADKCIALEPTNPKGYFAKGLLSFVLKDWQDMQRYLRKAVDLAPNNVEILSNAGIILITGGYCSLDEYRDKQGKRSSYTEGDCQWKPGFEMLQKAFELDKGNLYPVKNYGIAHVYNLWGEYENAYEQMQLAVSPGFIWYEMHSAIAAAGMKDETLARKHFDAVQKIIGSNNISDAHAHFKRWHIPQYWDMSKGFLTEYGFQ